ncbi:ATP-binding cassette domain-containing protein [Williamsoniiplasma lucivorax]|uniref:ABC transporter ATP-binding protein n=1 Tax=Williamsoniiplasma lucivorax TaxID=209274 RepID=A0A2S5RFP1_9MOLU|nr:ABC transporter ATP-binding protein [Williamsoniiplasma lucivorax]PPE06107.1 ABC transporter ATP-binding protein [Williamsoniiplasma lucivorax]
MHKKNINDYRDEFVSLEDYEKCFSQREVIGPLNFGIAKNKVTLIVGRSGSGKSVILNSIMGTYTRYKGKIKIDGLTRKTINGYKVNDKIGYYAQMDFLSYDLKLITYLHQISRVFGIKKDMAETKIKELLQLFELEAFQDKKIKDFSWGMKNRLNLIISLLKDPQLIVWDEPGANLDSVWFKKIKNILINFKNQGRTIILVIHNIHDWMDVADNLILVDRGQILFNSDVKTINLYFKSRLFFKSDLSTHPHYKIFKATLVKSGFVIFEEDLVKNILEVGVLESGKDKINLLAAWLIKFDLFLEEIVNLPMNYEAIYNTLLYSQQIKELPFFYKNMNLINFWKLARMLKKDVKHKSKQIKKIAKKPFVEDGILITQDNATQLEEKIQSNLDLLEEMQHHRLDSEWLGEIFNFLKLYFFDDRIFDEEEQANFEAWIRHKLSSHFLIKIEEDLLTIAVNACLHKNQKNNDYKKFKKIYDELVGLPYEQWPKKYKVNKKINVCLTTKHHLIKERGNKLFW